MKEEPVDHTLIELAEVCSSMVKIGNQFLSRTAIGMYQTFVLDSTLGGDCNYAQKASKLFWEQQREGVVEQLLHLHYKLGRVLKEVEKHGCETKGTDTEA